MNQTVFVLMPFKPDLDEVYKEIVKPSVEKLGFHCIRADEQVGPSQIMDDIWRFINGGDLFIADLTGRNPNVFYELGLAHAQNKIVVLLTQSMDDIPFDLRHLRVIQYANTKDGKAKLEGILTETLENIINQISKPEVRNKYIVFNAQDSFDKVQDLKKVAFELAIDLRYLEFGLFDMIVLREQDKVQYSENFNAKINERLKILNVPYTMPGWINFLDIEERKNIRNFWINKISDEIKKNEKIIESFEFGRSWFVLTQPAYWEQQRKDNIENFVIEALYGHAFHSGLPRPIIDRMMRRFKSYINKEHPQNAQKISKYFRNLKDEILENLNATSR